MREYARHPLLTTVGIDRSFYAPIPAQYVDELRQLAKIVSYGWGVAPVEAQIGEVAFKTSLFPKDGGYLLPLKDAVRRQANVTAGDLIVVGSQPGTTTGKIALTI